MRNRATSPGPLFPLIIEIDSWEKELEIKMEEKKRIKLWQVKEPFLSAFYQGKCSFF